MKNLCTPIKLSVSLAALLLSQASFAEGTNAGVDVTNTATISYLVGGQTQTPITSDAAVFKVDRKINLTIAGTDTNNLVTVVPLSTGNLLNFTLQNTGNDKEYFKIEVEHLPVSDDTFNAGTTGQICQFTIQGDTTVYDITDTPVVEILEDDTKDIAVSCDIEDRTPNAAVGDLNAIVDGATSTIKVVATAVADAAGAAYVEDINTADVIGDIDVVFADKLGTDDANRDAKYSARETYEVEMPMLAVLKSSMVLSDPINGTASATVFPKRIPGAVVQYTITVENYSITTDATGVIVTDSLADEIATKGNFAFNPGSIKINSVAGGSFASDVVTATGITVPKGTNTGGGVTPGTAVVTFEVIITAQ